MEGKQRKVIKMSAGETVGCWPVTDRCSCIEPKTSLGLTGFSVCVDIYVCGCASMTIYHVSLDGQYEMERGIEK